ncbi:MAG TPA: 50S ribosomal protein L17 [Cytophagales bacterium]|nr:50S ribosomal protein L17 [Cytophagales bacterium]
MRHGNSINHLGRKTAHRNAMLSNMATSLILHKRITTTVAKAKELRKFVEPLITKSKEDTTHSRRTVFSYLQDKKSVSVLFNEVSEKVSSRPGGYTRIIKIGSRLGDNADMCIIELVDFNTIYTKETSIQTAKKTRRGKKSSSGTVTGTSTDNVVAAPVAQTNKDVDNSENSSEVSLEEKAE